MSGKRIIKDIINKELAPYLKGLTRIFSNKFDTLTLDLTTTDEYIKQQEITMNTTLATNETDIILELDTQKPDIITDWTLVSDNYTAHRTNTTNPHQDNPLSLFTIVSGTPANTIGENGDVFLSYLNHSYYYEVSSWGVCSAPCGGGTKTRTAICKQDGITVNNSVCEGLGITLPILSTTCNTQACPQTILIGGQKFKCFQTEVGSPSVRFPVSAAYCNPIGVTTVGAAPNYTWPHPILIDNNPFEVLTPPFKLEFFSKWNPIYGDKYISGKIKVEAFDGTNTNIILEFNSPTTNYIQYIDKIIYLAYKPQWIKIYYYMLTSSANQHMTLHLSETDTRPMVRCTDKNNVTFIYY